MNGESSCSGSSGHSLSASSVTLQTPQSVSVLATPKNSNTLKPPPVRLVQKMNTAKKSKTPKSMKSKTSWSVIQLKVQKDINMYIVCKSSRGKVGPFSSAGYATKPRPIWEPVNKCIYKVEKTEEGLKKGFEFHNIDNESEDFRADLFDPLLGGANLFNQNCTALLMSNPNLLASYLTFVSCSEGYAGHNPAEHTKMGFGKESVMAEEDILARVGGSMTGYREFLQAALDNVRNVGGLEGEQSIVKLSPATKKRKVTDFFTPVAKKKKMSKSEIVDDRYRGMISDENGLEKSVVSAYLNVKLIELDRLHVSPDMFLPINQSKVADLVESMTERLEVSQLVVSVVPADLTKFMETGKDDKFWVIHGVHRLEAMKKLDILNRIKPVPGFPSRRSILCFIVQISSPSLSNYINVKCNDLAHSFQSRSSNESLFFVYKGLLDSSRNEDESLEVVEKICHSRHCGVKELAVYRKVADWPRDVFEQLIAVLDKFQNYRTMDCTARGSKERIKRREANVMTNEMFRQLGECKPEFFKENHHRILENISSLKEVLVESGEKNKIGLSELKVAACSVGCESVVTLKQKYPEMFTPQNLRQYSKAEIRGKKKNQLGMRLRQYVKSVQLGTEVEEPVKFEIYQTWFEITIDKLEGFDVVVLNIGKENLECAKCWIDSLSCSTKESYAILVILESEAFLQDIYKALETWKDKPDFRIHMCVFKKQKSTTNSDDINENGVFSILFGKINIFNGPVMSVNDELSKDLIKCVQQVTPPNGKVAYVSKGNHSIVKIHEDEGGKVEVTYFVTKVELPRVQEKFLLHSVATRSTPAKPPIRSIANELDESAKAKVSKQQSCTGEYDTDEDEFFVGVEDEDEGGEGYEEVVDGSDDNDHDEEEEEEDEEEEDESSISRQSSTSSKTH